MPKRDAQQKAWVVSVDMGYGHERTAYALRDLAYGRILIANNYPGISKRDKELWEKSKTFYETVSRLKSVPLVGNYLFETYDKLQEIKPFYPRRDLSLPSLQVRQLYYMIEHHGFGRDLIDHLRRRNLPLVTTFFMPAFAAEVFGFPGEIYCVATDTDISRAWAPLDPKKSRIKYFAPNGRVVERLKLYGVRPENIFLTGFPLPKELVDGPGAVALKRDLARRLNNLDPHGIFRSEYDRTLHQNLGKHWHSRPPKQRTLTLTFSVGGAGAQWKLGLQILKSLRLRIARGEIIFNLEAGTHASVRDAFLQGVKENRLRPYLNTFVHVRYSKTKAEYFPSYTRLLKKTDILWTKPSEQSFYTGAGIPIIIAPPLGSQEDFNARWLQTVGGGVPQNDPQYTNEWLFDWVESGGLARMAWSGYVEAPTHGAYRIQSVVTDEEFPLPKLPSIV
ncbi:MAG: hypothetical protein WC817_01770 [Patescibacteria group bacterium]|jgi:hypothetical protein